MPSVYPVYCCESLESLKFLRLSLHDSVMRVLGDDDLDLEIEPTILWSRCDARTRTFLIYHPFPHIVSFHDTSLTPSLPEAEQVHLFGPHHGTIGLNTITLLACAPFEVSFQSSLQSFLPLLHSHRLGAGAPSLRQDRCVLPRLCQRPHCMCLCCAAHHSVPWLIFSCCL